MYVVWRPSECALAGPVSPGTKTLTARSDSFGTSSETGPLTISAPAGIVTAAVPLNVNGRSEPGMMDESVPRNATWAPPTLNGAAPKALERCTRSRLPPRLVRAIIRTVWLLNALGGGATRGAAGAAAAGPPRPNPAARGCCCADAQVATQWV